MSAEVLSIEGQLVGMPLAGPESFSQQQLNYLKSALHIDETVLFEGSMEASTGGTANVSENPNNFEYLRFEFCRGSLNGTATVFKSATGGVFGRMCFSLTAVNNDSTQFNVYCFGGSFANNVFTVDNFATKLIQQAAVSTSTSSPLTLNKIIGIHRVAGGN